MCDQTELAAENERLRKALQRILDRCQQVAVGDVMAGWLALGYVEETAKHALSDDGGYKTQP